MRCQNNSPEDEAQIEKEVVHEGRLGRNEDDLRRGFLGSTATRAAARSTTSASSVSVTAEGASSTSVEAITASTTTASETVASSSSTSVALDLLEAVVGRGCGSLGGSLLWYY